jgi:hypothetical protein
MTRRETSRKEEMGGARLCRTPPLTANPRRRTDHDGDSFLPRDREGGRSGSGEARRGEARARERERARTHGAPVAASGKRPRPFLSATAARGGGQITKPPELPAARPGIGAEGTALATAENGENRVPSAAGTEKGRRQIRPEKRRQARWRWVGGMELARSGKEEGNGGGGTRECGCGGESERGA